MVKKDIYGLNIKKKKKEREDTYGLSGWLNELNMIKGLIKTCI